MSETTLGHALVFMRQPQDVEVHRGGNWALGSMVGWRQEDGSSCRVMIRVSEAGVEKTAWADLHDVRLPAHRSCPPTESLPFLPQLPAGRTEQTTGSGTWGGWGDQQDQCDSAELVTPRIPRADAATGPMSLVAAPTNGIGPETGRHRAPAGTCRREKSVGRVRPPGSSSGEVEPTRLLTLPGPCHGQAVTPRHGDVAAH